MNNKSLGRELSFRFLYRFFLNEEHDLIQIYEKADWHGEFIEFLAAPDAEDRTQNSDGIEVITPEAKVLAEKLIDGVLINSEVIRNTLVQNLENWKLENLDLIDKVILFLSIYELTLYKETPPKVAINEAINLGKKFSEAKAPQFINSVLDKIHKQNRPE